MSETDRARRASADDRGADDRGAERRILVWMCVLIGVNQLGFGGVVPALPLYAQSFGVSASAIGMAVAVYGLARFFVAMPTGRLADSLGRRPTLALGGALSAVGNLWCAEASGFPEFLLARFVAGAGAGFVVTGGHVVLADISTPERRGRMMAVYQGVFLFAVGLGPLPGGWLAQHYGLDAPFHAYAIAGTLVSALAFLAVPETRDFRDQRAVLGGKRPAHLAQLKALFSQTGFLLVSLVMFVNAFTRTGGLFNVVPVLGVERLGLSTTQIGFGLALGSLGGLVVTYPAGTLADRYGRKSVIVPSTVIMALSYFMYCLAPSYAWFLAACVAWGTAASVAGAAPAAYAVDSAPPGMNAAAVSSFRLLSDLGYVIGPIVMGLMVDFHSAEFALTASSIALLLIGLTFALKAPETYSGWRRSDR